MHSLVIWHTYTYICIHTYNFLQIRKKFSGSLLVESHSPVTPVFSQYFAEAVLNKTSVAAPLAQQYMDTVAHCDSEVSIMYCA